VSKIRCRRRLDAGRLPLDQGEKGEKTDAC
jgi:hypothetical protein